jgi:UV DNA damage endonuclease
MEYKNGRMVLHIGSSQGGKEDSIKRFIINFKNFPYAITSRLMLENDDKTFTAAEVLGICKEVNAPMVLDIHHHVCNNDGENLSDMISDIFSTWNNQPLPPKIHISSPKEGPKDRKHSDFINAEDFAAFVELCKPLDIDFDVMIEAKKKDLSLYRLAEDIKEIRPDWNWIDNTTLEV